MAKATKAEVALVTTELAVYYLTSQGAEPQVMQRRLYDWAKKGQVKNYGKGKRGQALWDLWELEAKMGW